VSAGHLVFGHGGTEGLAVNLPRWIDLPPDGTPLER